MALVISNACCCRAYAQWTGSVNASGNWNFAKNNKENLDFNLKYSGRKFYAGASLSGGHNYLISEENKSIIDGKKEGKEYWQEENKSKYPRVWKGLAKINLGYNFNPSSNLDLKIGYSSEGKNDFNELKTDKYIANKKDPLSGKQIDTVIDRKKVLDSRLIFTKKMSRRPDGKLSVALSSLWGRNFNDNLRITDGQFYSKPKYYTTYSYLNDLDAKLSATYDDKFDFGSHCLKMTAGLDVDSKSDIDIYEAETFSHGVWKDSVQYRQSYYYYSLSVEPNVKLTYSIGKFDINLTERLQWYGHGLIDKLHEKQWPTDLDSQFEKHDWENILSAGVVFKANPRHRFSLDYSHTINRPDYKKLCSTLMIGKSEGEYLKGNPDLKPEVSDRLKFRYSYTKDIFVTSLEINYLDKSNTAEKVMDLDFDKTYASPDVRVVYTWVNTQRQQTLGAKLNLDINAQLLTARMWNVFNYEVFHYKTKDPKQSWNYELGISVDAKLNKSAKLSSELSYKSAKESAYNLKGEDVIANLRYTHRLSECLEMYVELHDLVDKPNYEETWNEQQTYLKISEIKAFERSVILGLSLRF